MPRQKTARHKKKKKNPCSHQQSIFVPDGWKVKGNKIHKDSRRNTRSLTNNIHQRIKKKESDEKASDFALDVSTSMALPAAVCGSAKEDFISADIKSVGALFLTKKREARLCFRLQNKEDSPGVERLEGVGSLSPLKIDIIQRRDSSAVISQKWTRRFKLQMQLIKLQVEYVYIYIFLKVLNHNYFFCS